MGVGSLSKIVELFGNPVEKEGQDWSRILQEQQCVYLGRKCWKVRKSDSGTSIGTCSVLYGKLEDPIIICPTRLLDRRQVFTDCLHLLTNHEPGNELHLVSEVSIPGGSIDFFLISSKE